jgi:hypothetical protein
MGIGNLFHFSVIEHLSSSTVVGPYSYYPPMLIFLTTVIDETSNIL